MRSATLGVAHLPGPRGLPLLKPPFGSIVAIDMNSGEHRWRIPLGL
jgi:quinoprotein glucose dehydrogenase